MANVGRFLFKKTELKRLYSKYTSSQIAKMKGCSKNTVTDYCRLFGIKARPVGAGYRLGMKMKPYKKRGL
jgi:hypothetical protein